MKGALITGIIGQDGARLFIMVHYEESEIINTGTGKETSIEDLAEMIKEVVGFEDSIRFDTTKPDGMPRKLLAVS